MLSKTGVYVCPSIIYIIILVDESFSDSESLERLEQEIAELKATENNHQEYVHQVLLLFFTHF